MSTVTFGSTPQEALFALARFIKTVRLNQEMTRDELAVRTGTSRSTLARFEKSGAGSTENLVKIFAALGVLDDFVSIFALPDKPLTIAELKKMSTRHTRQRGKRRGREVS